MALSETIQFQATPEWRRQVEAEAQKLNLTLAAYIFYLHERAKDAERAPRLDQHVHELFGKHGELLRRLAK